MVKKILHITMSNAYSGAENVACQIISMFKMDSDVEMLYCGVEGPNIRNALKERNISFIPMRKRSVKEVARVIREVQPTMIHAHDMRASFYVALTCGKTPFVSHIHNNNFDSRGISLKSVLYYYAARKAAHIFWVSKSAYEGYAFHNQFQKKSSILYNVIDISALYEKVKADEKRYSYDIVYVGRLTYPKNPQRLVGVLAGVARQLPKMKAAIIGTGELAGEIEKEIKALHVENNIDMLGFCTNPYKIMKSAKVLLMTSRWEGLPMCALEAMALGVPIVSTPTDGLKELIENGENGFLSEDDQVLQEKCCSILTNASLHKLLHISALGKAHQILNIDSYKKEIEKAYQ